MEQYGNQIVLPLYQYKDPVTVVRDVIEKFVEQAAYTELELIKQKQSLESRIFTKISFYLSADIPEAEKQALHYIDTADEILEAIKKCKARIIRIGWTAEIQTEAHDV